ncbi:MAG: glycosyl hydrolase, partial [Pseudomonadota bacterium]
MPALRGAGRLPQVAAGFAALLAAAACAPPGPAGMGPDAPLFIVGQDLGAIRGYVTSGCCVAADGTTAYVDFYDIRSADGGYGGLGIDLAGEPVAFEADWGSGPVNAYKAATEFAAGYLAIGLSITENEHPGGLDQLVAGERDAEIRQLAVFAHRVDATILLRIGYEFDGAWNRGYQDAPRFVAAYRRIVDGLRAAGVTNVRYVWQGAASTTDVVLDGGRHDDIADWYPGDRYVDWLGLSWFMHPEAQPEIELAFDVPTPRELADEVL